MKTKIIAVAMILAANFKICSAKITTSDTVAANKVDNTKEKQIIAIILAAFPSFFPFAVGSTNTFSFIFFSYYKIKIRTE